MKVVLPKIKTKHPLKKEYGRVTVHKEAKNLDDPNVSSKPPKLVFLTLNRLLWKNLKNSMKC